jgi:aryl-alcohol dehydrogenase-like predicted oxidoreductase
MSKKKLPVLNRRDALKVGATAAAAAVIAPRDLLAQESTPQVPKRKLGKTGKEIPILLFGAAVSLDTKFDPKLAEAMRYGVNYFDTADCYGGGNSETAVGNFLARTKARDKAWITSKSDEHDAEGLEKTLNVGLKKLQTNWVDLYYLHALNDTAPLNDKALERKIDALKAQGKIKHFGFSCHGSRVVDLLNLAAERPWIESIMFRYNFRKYGDKELNLAMDKCAKAGIGLIAMKTQGSEASFKDAWKKFEKKGKWTKHQAVLKAVWEDPRITAAVSAMKSFEQLRQNIAAAVDKTKLGALEKDALFRYAEATRCYACDGCDHHCNPAVEGPAAIGDTMRGVMYHDVYGDEAKGRETLAKLPTGALDLDYAKANTACPNGLDVVRHIQRAREIVKGEGYPIS